MNRTDSDWKRSRQLANERNHGYPVVVRVGDYGGSRTSDNEATVAKGSGKACREDRAEQDGVRSRKMKMRTL